MRIIIILLVILFLALQYRLWFAKRGITETLHLKAAVAQQEKANQVAYHRNQRLTRQIWHLKFGRHVVESLAREKGGMIKPGEVYYQFLNPSQKGEQ